MKAPLLALWLGLAAAGAHAASVTLTGTIGNRAILVVNGGAPKTVAIGEKLQNVRLVSLQDGQAVVESAGQRITLRMDSPVSVGGGASVNAAPHPDCFAIRPLPGGER